MVLTSRKGPALVLLWPVRSFVVKVITRTYLKYIDRATQQVTIISMVDLCGVCSINIPNREYPRAVLFFYRNDRHTIHYILE